MKKLGRRLFYQLPPWLRFPARRFFYLPLDAIDKIFGKRDDLTPPKGLIYTGSGDFKRIGAMQLRYFREFCDLKPNGSVLDIGSGMGRSAIPLTAYLNESGRYEGFDVVKRGVDWCAKNITRSHPNFNFTFIPLNNDLYRSDGPPPAKFQFPYPDNSFDLIIVNSVFTHMVADEVENYFKEMARVLKTGGVAYTTFFIYEDNKTSFPPDFKFPFHYGHYRLMDEKVKSANVAYRMDYLKKALIAANGFKIRHLFAGSWQGLPKEKCKEFQDLVIFEKKKTGEP